MKPFRRPPSFSLGLERRKRRRRTHDRDGGAIRSDPRIATSAATPHTLRRPRRVPPGEWQDRDRPNALILDTELLCQILSVNQIKASTQKNGSQNGDDLELLVISNRRRVAPVGFQRVAQLGDVLGPYPSGQFTLQLSERFESQGDRPSTGGSKHDPLRPTVVWIIDELDQPLAFQTSDKCLCRLSGDSQPSGQIGRAGALCVQIWKHHRLSGGQLGQTLVGKSAPESVVEPSEPLQEQTCKIHGIVSISDELYSWRIVREPDDRKRRNL